MTKVTMEYLQANGRYRQATAHTESQWPNFLINHSDHQAHSLVDSPVFAIDRQPTIFETWEEFLEAPPPKPKHFPDKLCAVCEDQSIWPICSDMAPNIQDRQMLFKEFAEDAEQNAVVSATRAAGGSSLINAWSIASLMIFCLMSVFILLIVLQSNLAQGLIPDKFTAGPATALVLTGMVFPFRRRKVVLQSDGMETAVDTAKPKRKKHRELKDLETLRVWDETSNYVWSASLPLSEILGRIPIECRYTQEVGVSRLMGMALCGGIVAILGVLCTAMLEWPLIWGGLLTLACSGGGVLIGALKGYEIFMSPPIWIVRRLHQRVPIDPNDESQGYMFNYEELPMVLPEFHTKLTGLPMAMAIAERRHSAEEALRSTSTGNGYATALATRNLAIAFTPRIWRASMLYEMLKGRDIKARMKGPGTKSDKLQKISMAGMALGSVGLLIVAMVFLG